MEIELWHEMKRRHIRERIELIESVNDRGLSLNEAAAVLQMGRENLRHYCERYGIEWKTKEAEAKYRARKDLFDARVPLTDAARELGTPVNTLRSWAVAQGVRWGDRKFVGELA